MILKALTLENFKGIREPVRIEFAPVTLLFGPNNAGKSTVVQALHYAREIFERGNADPGRTLLGGDVWTWAASTAWSTTTTAVCPSACASSWI